MNLLSQLVAYYRCDEASGPLLDVHGGYHLTANNAPGSAAGILGTSRQLVRASVQWFSHADDDIWTPPGAWTMACWIYADALYTDGAVLSKWGGLGSRSYWLGSRTDGRMYFDIYSAADTSERQHTAVGSVTVGAWHWLCGGIGADGKSFFQVDDATPVKSTVVLGPVQASTGDFNLGGVLGGANWDGRIDEFGLWHRELSADERIALYNGGLGLAYEAFGHGGSAWQVPPRPRAWQAGPRPTHWNVPVRA